MPLRMSRQIRPSLSVWAEGTVIRCVVDTGNEGEDEDKNGGSLAYRY